MDALNGEHDFQNLSAVRSPLPFPQTLLHADQGHAVIISGGHFLLTAEFIRSGPDLILHGPDGGDVVVAGYFATHTPPDLISESGGVISAALASSLAGPIAPGQIAQAGNAVPQLQPIGTVDKLIGAVTLRHSNGVSQPLSQGDTVYQGDLLQTGKDGAVGIIFADRTTFSLGKNGRMVMDELVYDPQSHTGHSSFSVVQGSFSFVSGQIAKAGPDAMTVKTPVMTIGIRGTTVAGQANAEGEENSVALLSDADGGIGQIAVSNQAGTQILMLPNQAIQLSSAFTPPPPPVILPPQQIQQMFSDALQSRPSQPTSDPHINGAQPGNHGTGGQHGGKTESGSDSGSGSTGDASISPHFMSAMTGSPSAESSNPSAPASNGPDQSTTPAAPSPPQQNSSVIQTPALLSSSQPVSTQIPRNTNTTTTETVRGVSDFSSATNLTVFLAADQAVVNGIVQSLGGHTSIIGTPGNDSFVGGVTAQGFSLMGNGGTDSLIYQAGVVATVDLYAQTAQHNGISDHFTGLTSFVGNSGSDVLQVSASTPVVFDFAYGTAQFNGVTDAFSGFQTIIGGSGNDTFKGANAGHLTLYGGGGTDTLDETHLSEGVTIDPGHQTAVHLYNAVSYTDVLSGFEVYLGTNYNDTFISTTGDETFYGGGGTNLLQLTGNNMSYGDSRFAHYSSLQRVSVTGSNATVTLAAAASAEGVTQVSSSGAGDEIVVAPGFTSALTVTGSTQGERFVADGANLDVETFNGGGGQDVLEITGTTALPVAHYHVTAIPTLQLDVLASISLASGYQGTGLDLVMGAPTRTTGLTLDASGFGAAISLMGGLGNDSFIVATNYIPGGTVIGGGGADLLQVAGSANVTDTLFTHVSGISGLRADSAVLLTLGSVAQAEGIVSVDLSNNTSDLALDMSGYTTAGLSVHGGGGTDHFLVNSATLAHHTITGGTGFSFIEVMDSGALQDSVFAHLSAIQEVKVDTASSVSLASQAQAAGVHIIDVSGDAASTLTVDLSQYSASSTLRLIANGGTLSSDTMLGGQGVTVLELTGTNPLLDVGFAHISTVQEVAVDGASSVTLAALAQAAGIRTVDLSGDAAAGTTLDLSQYSALANLRVIADGSKLSASSIIGGGGTNVLEVTGSFTLADGTFAKIAAVQTLTLDGPGDVKSVILGSNAAALTGAGLSLIDASANVGEFALSVTSGFTPATTLSVIGGGSGNDFTLSDLSLLSHLHLDGGAGNSTLVLTGGTGSLVDANFSTTHLANIDAIKVSDDVTSVTGGANFMGIGAHLVDASMNTVGLTFDFHTVTSDITLIGAQDYFFNTFIGGTGNNTFVAGYTDDLFQGNASAASNVIEYDFLQNWTDATVTHRLQDGKWINIDRILFVEGVGTTNVLTLGTDFLQITNLPILDASWSAAGFSVTETTHATSQGVYSIIGGTGNNTFTLESVSDLVRTVNGNGNGFSIDGGVGHSTLSLTGQTDPLVDTDFAFVTNMDVLQLAGGLTSILVSSDFSAAGFSTVDASTNSEFVTIDLSAVTAAGTTTLIGASTNASGFQGNTLIGSANHTLHGASDIYVVDVRSSHTDHIQNFSASTDHVLVSMSLGTLAAETYNFTYGSAASSHALSDGEALLDTTGRVLYVSTGDASNAAVDLLNGSNSLGGFSGSNIDLDISVSLSLQSNVAHITAGAGDDVIRWTAPDLSSTVFLDGGAGHDILYLIDPNNTSTMELNLSAGANTQEIVGGATAEVKNFESVDASAWESHGTTLDLYVHATDSLGHFIAGSKGFDLLQGGTGADTLVGGNGSYAWTTMIGGGGGDTIIAGTGVSVLEFDTPTIAVTGGPEHVLNFDLSKDYLVLPSSINSVATPYASLDLNSVSETLALTVNRISSADIHTATTDINASAQSLGSGAGVVLFYQNTASTHLTELWFTNDASQASSSNSYQIALLDHVKPQDIMSHLDHVITGGTGPAGTPGVP